MKLSPAETLPTQQLESLQTRLNDTRDWARAGIPLTQRPVGYDVAVKLYPDVYALLSADQQSVVFSDGSTFSAPQKLLSQADYDKLAVMGIEVGLASPALPEIPRGSAPDRRAFSRDNTVYNVVD